MSEDAAPLTIGPCTIYRLAALDMRYRPIDWPFARERRAEIDAHWAKVTAANPHVFNGQVLIQYGWTIEAGVYRASYSPVDYASFLAWRDFGWPDRTVRNGFAMAALQASDGAFVLGMMGAQTSNAGRIYFPGGTPDHDDVTPDGRVDLDGSLRRELSEETGLTPHEVMIENRWFGVVEGPRVAFLKPARLIWPAEEARAQLRRRLVTLAEQELGDIVIVRGAHEIREPTMPPFAAAYMRAVFDGRL